MTTKEQTFELLEATGLNWTVNKINLVSPQGYTTESFGIFRNDSNEWLGTVGNRYVPMQNYELAETIVEATNGIGLVTTKGGQLSGGAKVYLQAELPDEFIGKSGVKRHITALNSHDGSSSIGFGSSSTVVVCTNTFYRAYKGLDKFRHTASAKERIDRAVLDLRKALELDKALMDNFKRMADIPYNDQLAERLIRKLFDVEPMTSKDSVSTRKLNQVTAFANSIEKEINLEGNTIWALFNAVTRYTNHVAAPKNADDKAEYLMTGGGYKFATTGYEEIMDFITKNIATPAHYVI